LWGELAGCTRGFAVMCTTDGATVFAVCWNASESEAADRTGGAGDEAPPAPAVASGWPNERDTKTIAPMRAMLRVSRASRLAADDLVRMGVDTVLLLSTLCAR
jgi:hypothetical protein